MSDSKLAERLRERGDYGDPHCVYRRAASALEAAETALAPFAEKLDELEARDRLFIRRANSWSLIVDTSLGDLRSARAAYALIKGGTT